MISRRVLGKAAAALGAGAMMGQSNKIPLPMQYHGESPPDWAPANVPASPPNMPWFEARSLALQIPAVREALEREIIHNNFQVERIDADLEILKALSPMAKIYHQRQRNIANDRKAMLGEQMLELSSSSLIENKIQELMWKKVP